MAVLKQEHDMLTEEFLNEIAPAIETAVDRAYVLFQNFGWTYWDREFHEGPPTRQRLHATIIELFEMLDEEDDRGNVEVSTGRFEVSRVVEEGCATYRISLRLSSVFEEDYDE